MDRSKKELKNLKTKLDKNIINRAALQKVVGGSSNRQSMYSSGAQSGNG